MKLVLAIIHDEDAGRLTTALNKEGFQVTKLASTGGFLRVGNTTMLIGVEEDRLDEALKMERQNQIRESEIAPTEETPDMGGRGGNGCNASRVVRNQTMNDTSGGRRET